jgi:hypothetical protein
MQSGLYPTSKTKYRFANTMRDKGPSRGAQDLLTLATAMNQAGLGFSDSIGQIDPNKMVAMQMAKDQIPESVMPMLLQMAQGDPAMMGKLFPQLAQAPEETGMPDISEIAALLGQPEKKPKERRRVTSEKYGDAEAVIGEDGSIMGYMQPGTDTPFERYAPSAESVGAFPAFTAGAKDKMSGWFDWLKPQFNSPAIPLQQR